MEIDRDPTEAEKKDFIPISDTHGKYMTPEMKFRAQVANEMEKASLKGLPFAHNAVIDEWKTYYDEWVKAQKRKYGFVKLDEFVPFKVDWAKY
ncbi:MAG: hypothetical protein AABY22_23860, partial [Nanoarchaeota archaeon]